MCGPSDELTDNLAGSPARRDLLFVGWGVDHPAGGRSLHACHHPHLHCMELWLGHVSEQSQAWHGPGKVQRREGLAGRPGDDECRTGIVT
jgi:hypothetical protein